MLFIVFVKVWGLRGDILGTRYDYHVGLGLGLYTIIVKEVLIGSIDLHLSLYEQNLNNFVWSGISIGLPN